MGSRPLTLRARLLLALAYVLVLAIVALEVPLAISLRDRVDAEVTSQSRSQADVVAATVSGGLDQPRALASAATTATNHRPRRRVRQDVCHGRAGFCLARAAWRNRVRLAAVAQPPPGWAD